MFLSRIVTQAVGMSAEFEGRQLLALVRRRISKSRALDGKPQRIPSSSSPSTRRTTTVWPIGTSEDDTASQSSPWTKIFSVWSQRRLCHARLANQSLRA